MKRRQLLIGSLLGTAALAVGIKKTEPVVAAPAVIDPDPVTEKLIDSGPYHGPYDWSSEIEEARLQILIERMKQTPWYQLYTDQKVMENLGIPAPKLITHRYVTYPVINEIANRGGYTPEYVVGEIAKSLT